jgi:hypothetical protein
MGERQTIRWVTTGCTNMSASPFIALFLQSAQADLTYMHGDPNGGKIAEVAPDQHSYDWVVGAVWGGKILQPAEGFKVQVPGILFNPTATEQYDPNRTTLGGAFRIWPEGTSQATIQQAQAAMNHTIRLISPFGNEVWEAGRVHDIQWVWNGPRKPNVTVSLYLYKGTANLGLIVGGISASTGHFAWTIPTTFAGKLQPFGKGYAIQVVVDALPTVNSKSPKPFSISRPILRSGRP